MPQNIAIVGSGFLGMTLALRLADSGAKVTIFESADQIGGLASTWRIGDFEWDRHYHVTLGSDSFTRKLVEELGLGSEFKWVKTKTGFYTDGKLYSMSDTIEFLRFPALGLISKFRLGATIFYASRYKDWKALEKIPVEHWLTKLSGKRTFEKIWKPLLKAKLGEAYRETSAAFIWATIQRMYAARNSGMKTEMFGYVRGGYANILRNFSEKLSEKGVDIRLSTQIEKIETDADDKVRVVASSLSNKLNGSAEIPKSGKTSGEPAKYGSFRTAVSVAQGFSGMFLSEPSAADGIHPNVQHVQGSDTFDKVILTCHSGVAPKLLPTLTKDEKAGFENIRYQGIVCASVLLKYPLSKFYVTNITDESPFTGVIEMSALVDRAEFGGNSLVYLPKYVAPDDELFARSDEEIKDIFLSGLEKMYPHFRRSDVLAFNVSRVRQVFPIPVVNYSDSLPSVRTSVENVYVVNSSHIVNGTLNVNETIQLAERFFSEHLTENGAITGESV